MKDRLLFLVKYLLVWIVFFQSSRVLFLLYHIKQFIKIPFYSTFASMMHGFVLDLSMASYISIFPFFLIFVSVIWNHTLLKKITQWYTWFILWVCLLITMVDLELFSAWGFRFDSTVFRYINTPNEVFISTLAAPWILLTFIFIVFLALSMLFFRRMIMSADFQATVSIWTAPIFLMLTCALIIPIRGGLQLATLNESAVYFSNYQLANQAAINCHWHFAHSLLEKSYDDQNPFQSMSDEEALKRFTNLYTKYPQDSTERFLRTPRPNIVLVIWESFTAKALVPYEGAEVLPQFKSLTKEGIYFDRCYASGDRTEKGIVAVLSGYPAQSTTSIIQNTTKNQKLPSITAELKSLGYSTHFTYGGEIEFANIKTYLINSGFDHIISKDDFDKKYWNSKWGAHDEYTYKRLINIHNSLPTPFFSVLLTLTSHEPFEIPAQPLLKPDSREKMFMNSLHYADACLGKFIQDAKHTAWWNNTVVIVVADHGHPLPGNGVAEHHPSEFHIPLLILGGAIKIPHAIHKTTSQTDIVNILFNSLALPDSSFVFGKNTLASKTKSFAYYAFNNGFGFVTDSSAYVWDNVSQKTIFEDGHVLRDDISDGRAHLQFSFRDYLQK